LNIARTCSLLAVLLFAPQVVALTENFTPGIVDYVFYTFVISAILFSSAILLAYRAYRWFAYVGFVILLLLSHAATGGVVAYLIGATDFVLFVVPYLVFGALTVYGLWMVGWLIEEEHRLSRYRTLFYTLAVVAALGPLTSFIWLMRIPLNLMWIPEQALYLVMIAAQVIPPISWNTQNPILRRCIHIFPGVIALFIIGSNTISNLVLDISREQQNTLSRLTIALFVLFSLVLVLWKAFSTSREKGAREKEALEAAKREAELQLALNQAEQEYEQARVIALQHKDQLARVSHDLKQPLAALRVAAATIEDEQPSESGDTLSKAVEYVDQIAQSYTLQAADEHVDRESDSESIDAVHGTETVNIQTFSDLLTQMFMRETQQKNIEFKVRTTDAHVAVIPIVAMRIMTNLIGNAIAHAKASQVLVDFRANADKVVFEVRDNGVGMDAADLDRALRQGGKAEASAGEGLGLSIVQDFCAAERYEFDIASTLGKGTFVSVAFPRVN
jgi:signal transduction histidine kinase